MLNITMRMLMSKNGNEFPSSWTTKTWTNAENFEPGNLWSDGINIYYSSGTTQKILNTSTGLWSTKTWSGRTNFSTANIWTDGETIYCSVYESSTMKHFYLNINTSTWTSTSFSGLTGRWVPANIWSDGTNVYYSNTRVLNKSTKRWLTKSWSGLDDVSSFNPMWITVFDGHIYYFNNTIHKELNTSTSTWNNITVTFNGQTDEWIVEGQNLFALKNKCYYMTIYSDGIYEFNPNTNNFSTYNYWTGLPTMHEGDFIWSDGTNLYYSRYQYYQHQYQLTAIPKRIKIGNLNVNKINVGTSSVSKVVLNGVTLYG